MGIIDKLAPTSAEEQEQRDRAAMIAALRELADILATRPEMPTPNGLHSIVGTVDEEQVVALAQSGLPLSVESYAGRDDAALMMAVGEWGEFGGAPITVKVVLPEVEETVPPPQFAPAVAEAVAAVKDRQS